jgi:hypothetical protein
MLATPGWASWRERRGGLGLTHCDDFAKFSSLHHANGLGATFRPHSGDVLLSNQMLLIHAEAAEPTV